MTLLKERCHQITHTVAANGRSRRRTATLIDNDELQQVNMQIDDAINEVSEKKKNMNDATKEAEDKQMALDEWNERFSHQNRDELIRHAKSVCQPAIDYYKRQFIEETGDLHKLRRRGMVCALFDPLF